MSQIKSEQRAWIKSPEKGGDAGKHKKVETKAAHQKVSSIKDLKFGQTFFTAVVALDLIYANLEAFFWSADDD